MRFLGSISVSFFLRKLWGDKRAAVGVLSAFAMVMLCGIIGLGSDASVWYAGRHKMQTMAEATALSAAHLLTDASQTTNTITAVATNDAMLNGFNGLTDTITLSFSPSPPPNATALGVTVTRKVPLMFAALFLGSTPTVSQSATATNSSGSATCIYVLDPSSSQTLLVNSNFSLNAPQCEIDVASTASTAAMFNSGSTLNVVKTCVAGGVTNNGAKVGNLQTGCTTHSNPYFGKLPAPGMNGCTVTGANYSGTANLSPGTYCGNFNFNGSGTLNLAAGLYIFNGTAWNINSGWVVNGTGVTLYFVNSSSYVQFNSGVTVSLTAPTSGTYNNVLIFEPDGLSKSNIAIDGTSSNGHALQGLVYLPSRNLTFNSAYSGVADVFTLVVNQVIFDSNNSKSWSITPAGNGGTSGLVLSN